MNYVSFFLIIYGSAKFNGGKLIKFTIIKCLIIFCYTNCFNSNLAITLRWKQTPAMSSLGGLSIIQLKLYKFLKLDKKIICLLVYWGKNYMLSTLIRQNDIYTVYMSTKINGQIYQSTNIKQKFLPVYLIFILLFNLKWIDFILRESFIFTRILQEMIYEGSLITFMKWLHNLPFLSNHIHPYKYFEFYILMLYNL